MDLFFTRLKFGHPEPLKALIDQPQSWKVYTICTERNPRSSTTFKDVSELEASDKTHARSAYVSLLGKAQNGFPLKDQYDKKRCHEVHSFIFNRIEITIYRIRTGDVRIYFCYLPPHKTIVLLKTKPKHKNELCTKEKNELQAIAEHVLQYSNPEYFESRVI